MRLKKAIIGAVMAAATMIIPGTIYANAFGSVATETLNVRAGAKMEAAVVELIDLGDPVEIVAEQGDWLKIVLQDDERGFVKAEYINVHRAIALVNVDSGLNVRDYPSTENGTVIGHFSGGEEISVHFRVGDWFKISQGAFEGYVHQDYVKNGETDYLKYLPTKKLSDVSRMTLTQEEAESAVVEAEEGTVGSYSGGSSGSSSAGSSVVAYAEQFLGNPYVYGGNSLTGGIDCSGFTSQVMRHFGVSLNRSSSAQYANNGYYVDSDSLRAGDLVFYGYNGHVSHVAIYIGGGRIIHANDERTGICYGNVFPSGGKPYIGAKRVL